MNPRYRTLLPTLGAALLFAACSEQHAGASALAANAPAAAGAAVDRALAAWQVELLDLAFKVASSLPADPHRKTRSRLQQQVAAACLQLEQPARAAACIEQIDGWQRGTGYADLACYYVRHGDRRPVPHLLQLAEAVAQQSAQDPNAQDWPRERIRAGIARAHLLLGEVEQAGKYAAGLPDFELGGVETVRVAQLDASAFDAEASTLSQVIATGNFDQVRGALLTCAQMFDTFYADSWRRARMQQLLVSAYDKLPADVRIDLLLRAADAALRHDDKPTALDLLATARQRLDAAHWLPEHHAPLLARLGALAHRAGDGERGRQEVDAAYALYLAECQKIVDIYRAGALRPVAEAWSAMGDRGAAAMVYKQAVEAGVANPNSRPRAEDLVATCCSLALHQVEPDAILRARIRQVCDGLGAPW